MGETDQTAPDLSETERQGLHEVELALEWLHRAHGSLMAFHHATGHAMDHLADAEEQLREADRTEVADAIRDEYLPRGVIDQDRWSYEVVEHYQASFLDPLSDFEAETREALADGRRHVTERRQEQAWKRRAEDE
jgi:hypothetical protein